MKTEKLVQWFKAIAIAEGISFLVLLLIAMPLKYLADLPEAVKLVGWMHGVLFVAFLALVYAVKRVLDKNLLWVPKACVASVVPFGTFMLHKGLEARDRK